MFKISSLLLSTVILTSCSFYRSAGRKQFEERAPNSVSSFSLQGCRLMSATETWLKEEFPSQKHELIEVNSEYEVWGQDLEQGQVEITVLSKTDTHSTESCTYKFQSKTLWESYKHKFLEELSNTLVQSDS